MHPPPPSECSINQLTHLLSLQAFESDEPSPVSPVDYIKRILKYGGCSKCCVVVGLMYLDKLKRSDSSVRLTSYNFQRLLLVSIMVAAKFFEDEYYSNRHWAEIGGLTVQELNSLELEFLFRMTFNLNVKRDQYEAFVNQIRDGAKQLAEARRRAMNMPKQPQLSRGPPPCCDSNGCKQAEPYRNASRGEQQGHPFSKRQTSEGCHTCDDAARSQVADSLAQVRAALNNMKPPSRSNSECSLCTTTSPPSPEAGMDAKMIKAAAVHSSD
jgi:hypothetical protein